jgi:hypothetical protein
MKQIQLPYFALIIVSIVMLTACTATQQSIKYTVPDISSGRFQLENIETNTDTYGWYGRINNDYAPRTDTVLRATTRPTEDTGTVSGRFNQNLHLLTLSGTSLNPIDETRIQQLYTLYPSKIPVNPKTIALDAETTIIGGSQQPTPFTIAFTTAAQDPIIFAILVDFLNDGGKIEPWTSSGRYNPKPLTLSIGIDENELGIATLIYHEALHYTLDKMDNVLTEMREGGGVDHNLIIPLENRFQILQLIDAGEVPTKDLSTQDGLALTRFSNDGLTGKTKAGRVGETINQFVNANGRAALQTYINSDEFYRNYVRGGMIPTLNHDYNYQNEDFFLDSGIINDIAFTHAINAALIREAYRIALAVPGGSITAAFRTQEFQIRFNDFKTAYLIGLSRDKSLQPGIFANQVSQVSTQITQR